MRDLPSVPSLPDAPAAHLQGHVWVQERLDAAAIRFEVAPEGFLRLGDDERAFDEAPPELRYANRYLDRTFALGAYLETIDEPSRYTFVGMATHHRSIDYDWDRLPPVVGTAIWDGRDERWLPPDRVERVFERLGPPSVNIVEKERSVEQQPLDGYEIPPSAWCDGPAAGVTFVDKRGNRAALVRSEVPADPPSVQVATTDPAALAEEFATDELIAARAAALREGEAQTGFDTLFEAVLDRLARQHHGALFRGVTDTGAVDLDWGAFRGAVAERVRRWLDTAD